MDNSEKPSTGGSPADLMQEWMTRDALAGTLGVSIDTLQKWESQRKGPPVTRIGRRVLYRRESVRSWMISQENSHPTRNARRGKGVS